MYVNEYFKRMKGLIVFRAMFGLLVHMLLMVEAQATCQTDYNGILLPCDVIQRWRDRKENYYKLERAFIIKRGHPSEHYSSLKLFWPEDAAPYFNRDRITFYKCINRTPTIAKTLMHIIRGGMGTPELVVDVMYAPVKYRLMNRVIITCHIYTARDESLGNRQEEPWNQFDIERYNDQIKPVGGQSTLANSTLCTTAVSLGTTNFTRTTATVALQSTTQKATTMKATTLKAITPKATELEATTLKATTKKTEQPINGGNELDFTDKETTKQISGQKKMAENYVTTPRTDGKEPRSRGTTEKVKNTTPIEATTQNTSKKFIPGEKIRQEITNVNSYTTKTSSERTSEARNINSVTTLGVTASSKTVKVTSEKIVTSPKIDNTTPKIEANCSKPDKTLCGGTNSGTNETTSTNKYSQGELINEINSSVTKTSPKPKASTVEVTSRRTVEVTSQTSKSTPVTNTVREVRIILCGEVNLLPNGAKDSKNDQTNKISSSEEKLTSTKSIFELTTKKIVTQKLDGENLVSVEGRRNSKPDDTSRNPSTSALYNLVAKTAKRKFGLAKISYQ